MKAAVASDLSPLKRALVAIETLQRRVASLESEKREPIAIVGIGCRFPGSCATVDAYWDLLRAGRDAITEVPASRWDIDALYDPDPGTAGKMVSRWGGFLDAVEAFDSAFFGVAPREADLMDPQQRIFLEVAWEALENAGCAPDQLAGSRTGVFLGVMNFDYSMIHDRDPASVQPYDATGSARSVIVGRLSHHLDLKGPCLTLDTACSSSLLAVHLACQSLRRGESTMALAGGINIIVAPHQTVAMSLLGAIAPDGRCKSFDARADGYVRGEGCGVVVLKRLSDALAARDHIWAVIRGSAVNHDGRSAAVTAPNGRSQQSVIGDALRDAGLQAADIGYVETHGTGTPLGDQVELEALQAALRGEPGAQPLVIGSVKSNIGHLDSVAGVAGLIKTALALYHESIPPSLHFRAFSSDLEIDRASFRVPAQALSWPRAEQPRRAGVSAWSFAGTNAHVIVEEAPREDQPDAAAGGDVIVLSAKSSNALEAATDQLRAHLQAHPDVCLGDIAHTLRIGRAELPHRRALVCRDRDDAIRALEARERGRLFGGLAEGGDPSIVFMFSGVGDQYVGVGRELYEREGVFRAQVDECCALLTPLLGVDLRTILYPPQAAQSAGAAAGKLDFARLLNRGASAPDANQRRLNQTLLAQPAVFVIEYALARLWMEWGARPDAMIGHSIGEYVAACLAGVFTRDDALRLVAARAKLLDELAPGSLLAIGLPRAEVEARLVDGLSLSAENAPALCVVGGSVDALGHLEERLRDEDISCTRVGTSHAFHSRLMLPAVAPFRECVAALSPRAPRLPFISNVTGTWISAEQATSADYWARHLCEPVQFARGIETLSAERPRLFLEIGPGQSLRSFVLMHAAAKRSRAVASLRYAYEARPDRDFLLEAVAKLWLSGARLDWSRFAAPGCRRVPLPTYPFEHRAHWLAPPSPWTRAGAAAPRAASAKRKREDVADWFYAPVWKRALLPSPPAAQPAGERLIVFARARGFGAALVAALRAAGAHVAWIQPGAGFRRLQAGVYRIAAGNPADYQRLVRDLEDEGQWARRVIYAWDVAEKRRAAADEPGQVAERGLQSLVYLAQALLGRATAEELRIDVISDRMRCLGGAAGMRPEAATLVGACTVIPQEAPQLSCRSIDIARSDSIGLSRLAEQVAAEVLSAACEQTVAYREGQRWVQDFEALRIEAVVEDGVPLRHGGVYLLTGGLGQVGFAIARALAADLKARLAIVGRSALPPRSEWAQISASSASGGGAERVRRIRELEALGAEVLFLNADVADAGAMRGALSAIRERYGALHGVIHAAGIAGMEGVRMVADLDAANLARQLRPKVQGTLVLEEVLAGVELDFVLLLSSLASLLGGLGFTAYSAANAFLDAFACSRTGSGRRWISLSSDFWNIAGDERLDLLRGTSVADFFMETDQGLSVVRRVLAARGLPHVVNSTGDLHQRLRDWVRGWARGDGVATVGNAHDRPDLATPFVAPANDVERRLVAIWESLLGVANIGVHDSFLELGGNSLLAMQIRARILKEFRIDVPIAKLFVEPTVANLAGVVQAGAGSAGVENIEVVDRLLAKRDAQLLERLDELSEDEVEAALQELERDAEALT